MVVYGYIGMVIWLCIVVCLCACVYACVCGCYGGVVWCAGCMLGYGGVLAYARGYACVCVCGVLLVSMVAGVVYAARMLICSAAVICLCGDRLWLCWCACLWWCLVWWRVKAFEILKLK